MATVERERDSKRERESWATFSKRMTSGFQRVSHACLQEALESLSAQCASNEQILRSGRGTARRVLAQNGPKLGSRWPFGQDDLFLNHIFAFTRPKWIKLVHFFISILAWRGPFGSANHTLATPEISKKNLEDSSHPRDCRDSSVKTRLGRATDNNFWLSLFTMGPTMPGPQSMGHSTMGSCGSHQRHGSSMKGCGESCIVGHNMGWSHLFLRRLCGESRMQSPLG